MVICVLNIAVQGLYPMGRDRPNTKTMSRRKQLQPHSASPIKYTSAVIIPSAQDPKFKCNAHKRKCRDRLDTGQVNITNAQKIFISQYFECRLPCPYMERLDLSLVQVR